MQYIPYRFPIKRSASSKATEFYLMLDKYNEYRATYPNLDVDMQIRKMRQWCIDNPSKRKTEGGMPKFINAWLSRESSKPQSRPYSTRGRTLQDDLNDRSWIE